MLIYEGAWNNDDELLLSYVDFLLCLQVFMMMFDISVILVFLVTQKLVVMRLIKSLKSIY